MHTLGRMNTTLVINSKGGAGKTTLATNLASALAVHGIHPAILDYDPQGSSLNWLRQRAPAAPRIHGANGAPPRTGLRSFALHVPATVSHLIIDAPAGASGVFLQGLLRRASAVLVPVQPSAIDVHATANFLRDLLLAGPLRSREVRLAVVANRVRRSSAVYQPLERFLASLGVPLLARLSDSDAYLEAAERGLGIFELDPSERAAERAQFLPIVRWAEPQLAPASVPNVLEFSRSGSVRALSPSP